LHAKSSAPEAIAVEAGTLLLPTRAAQRPTPLNLACLMAYARMATTMHIASAQMAIMKPLTVRPGLLTTMGLFNLLQRM